jgi:hypothetical protein
MYPYPAKDSPNAAAFLYPQPAPPVVLPKGHPFSEFDSDGYPIADVDSNSTIYEVPVGLSGRLTIRTHGKNLKVVLSKGEIELVVETLNRNLKLDLEVAPNACANDIGFGQNTEPTIIGGVLTICRSLTIRSGNSGLVAVEVSLGSALYNQTGQTTEFVLQSVHATLLSDADQQPFRSDTLIRLRSSKLFAQSSGLSRLPPVQIEPFTFFESSVDLWSDSVTVCPRSVFSVPKGVPHWSIEPFDESVVQFEAGASATNVTRQDSFTGGFNPRIEIHASKSPDEEVSIHHLIGPLNLRFVTNRGQEPANLSCREITKRCSARIKRGENATLRIEKLCEDLAFENSAEENKVCGHVTIASGERAVLVGLSGTARLGEIGSSAVVRGVENDFTLCSVNGESTATSFVSATFDNISVDLDRLDSLRLLAALRSASVVNLDKSTLKSLEGGSGSLPKTPIVSDSKADQEKRVSINASPKIRRSTKDSWRSACDAFRHVQRPRPVLLKDSHLGSGIAVASELVRAKSTEGTTRNAFAYREMAWRQVTATAIQERAILFVGRCLGFTYRVLRPIFVWLLLAVCWTIWASHSDTFDFSRAGVMEWVRRFLTVGVEPMAFFKGVESGKGLGAMPAFDQSWVLVLARFSMFIPLAFAVTAIARIARGRSING